MASLRQSVGVKFLADCSSDKLDEFLVENPSDVWSRSHGQDIYVFDSDEDDALWAVMRFSQPVDGKYLFDLS